jgi:peptidoglycan-N-acetylglucosamine deacetylase
MPRQSRRAGHQPREYPLIGTVQYQETLPLNDKEVVLTFDDGPMPPYTNRVLEALAAECVQANYFIVGRMARGYPDLLRRIHAEGHVIGTHSENHPLAFEEMQIGAVQAEIDQGFASIPSPKQKVRDAGRNIQ